jgi:hypothetical protein
MGSAKGGSLLILLTARVLGMSLSIKRVMAAKRLLAFLLP